MNEEKTLLEYKYLIILFEHLYEKRLARIDRSIVELENALWMDFLKEHNFGVKS